MNPNTNLCRIIEILRKSPAFSISDSPILTNLEYPSNYRTDSFDSDDIVLTFSWINGTLEYEINIPFEEVCRAVFNEDYIAVNDFHGDTCYIYIYERAKILQPNIL